MLKYHAAIKSFRRLGRTIKNTLNEKNITGIHHFSKVHITPLCFSKRPTLVSVFTKENNVRSAFVVQQTFIQAVHSPSSEWHHQAPSPETSLTTLNIKPPHTELSLGKCALSQLILCICWQDVS